VLRHQRLDDFDNLLLLSAWQLARLNKNTSHSTAWHDFRCGDFGFAEKFLDGNLKHLGQLHNLFWRHYHRTLFPTGYRSLSHTHGFRQLALRPSSLFA